MKKKLVLVVVILAGLVIFCAVRDIILKNVITVVTTNVVGAPTHIGGLSLSVINQSLKITDFVLYSPKGFPRDVMVNIALMKVSADILPTLS